MSGSLIRAVSSGIRYNLRSSGSSLMKGSIMSSANFSADSLSISHDKKRCMFFTEIGPDKAVLTYSHIGLKMVDLDHTEVPVAFRGKGVAAKLAESAFGFVVDERMKARLTCTYLQKYANDHPNHPIHQHVIP